MTQYRIAKLARSNARVAADPLQPSDPLFRADAAGPQPQEAPPLANDDSYTTNDATVVTGNLLTNDTPGDVPLAVTAVNGSALAVDREIILASGALLRVNSDGSFTYNPNNAFNAIGTTNDVFTYTVAGGDNATVTITVEDPPNPNIGTDNPETINGTPNDDVMDGRGGDDIVNGLGGNDSIDGGTGADQLNGSTGNDIYFVDNAGDTITELNGEGYDIVVASVNYTLTAGAYVEELVTTPNRAASITLTGNELANIVRGGNGGDILFGGGGNDTLIGGLGSDAVRGGPGDDTYFVTLGDTITELSGEGYDIVYVGSDQYIVAGGAFVELILPDPTVAFPGGVVFTGSNSDNEIRGTEGPDQLNGGLGADLMIGYGGNDIYTVDQAGDVIVEQPNAGNDTVYTLIDYVLTEGGNLENLNASGSGAPRSLGGNSVDNIISGSAFGDIIVGGGGNDLLQGSGGNDSLYGDAGNDHLVGGTGNDLMTGDLGNDVYIVDSAGDIVVEDVNEAGQNLFSGDDLTTSVSFTLAANQYIEIMAGTAVGITLTGNNLAQRIMGSSGTQTLIGNGGDDILNGGTGNDTTDGGFGDDIHYVDSANDTVVERSGEGRDAVYTSVTYTLAANAHVEALAASAISDTTAINLAGNGFNNEIYGNNGANLLNGGGGAGDYLVGYGGDDVYLIFTGAEIVVEAVNGGRDAIYTTVSYALAAGTQVEALSTDSIMGTNAINLTGNELNNEIYGNNGANLLNGGGGAGDYLVGWGGDDTYLVFTGGEIVVENASSGRDVIYSTLSYTLVAGSHVEVLSTNSNLGTTAIDLTGNEFGQEVYGNNGANTLNGGAGGDYMLGYGGADNFAFTTALGSGNADILGDFSVTDDTIQLENAVFTGLAAGALPASAFVTGAAAGDADDRIVYNSATGQIFFDADGSGSGAAQIHFATVNAGTVLTASDFTVI